MSPEQAGRPVITELAGSRFSKSAQVTVGGIAYRMNRMRPSIGVFWWAALNPETHKIIDGTEAKTARQCANKLLAILGGAK